MVDELLLCKQEIRNLWLHDPYAILVVQGDKGPSGFS